MGEEFLFEFDWNGRDIPPEFLTLPPGRYRITRVGDLADGPSNGPPTEDRTAPSDVER